MLLDDKTAELTESCLNVLSILNDINYNGITDDSQFELVEEFTLLHKYIDSYVKQLPKPTLEYMVSYVIGQLEESNLRYQREFKTTEFDKLIIYHHTIGQDIRNEFNLWSYPWTPMIGKDGADHSPNHPDAISMRVIEEAWRQVQDAS